MNYALLNLDDETLIEIFEKAHIYKLDPEFIEMVQQEINRRKLNIKGASASN